MRLLLTGGSSLTGMWLAVTCAHRGIEVHATLRNDPTEYVGARARRVSTLGASSTLHHGVRSGDGSLAGLISTLRPDVVAYHAHPMEGFRSAGYDYLAASAVMTSGLDAEMRAIADCGAAILHTGSVYEPGPWRGADARPAVSPYGLSKSIVGEVLRMQGAAVGVPVHRFVIPNPFGPLEEGRFGNHLAGLWARGQTPTVRTPNYIRDNIPVQELAERYARFVLAGTDRPVLLSPSGYIESQGRFAARLAAEVGERLGRTLPLAETPDATHSEPLVITGDGVPSAGLAENDSRYWDEYARFLDETMREQTVAT